MSQKVVAVWSPDIRNYVYSCSVSSAVFLFKNELSAATHLTSRLLKEYDKQVGQVMSATNPVKLAASPLTLAISLTTDASNVEALSMNLKTLATVTVSLLTPAVA